MQNTEILFYLFGFILFLLCFSFLFINKELITTLLIIESWWIGIYFIFAFLITLSGVHSSGLLLPLVLIFAGLEVVLGFYFLYFL